MQSLVVSGNFKELSEEELYTVNGGTICWHEVARHTFYGAKIAKQTVPVPKAILGAAIIAGAANIFGQLWR